MRLRAFILSFFYLLSITGYGLEFHYCLGEITDVNYALLETYCHCNDAHEGLKKGCCEEKEFFVQLDQDHQTPLDVNLGEWQLPLLAEWNWQVRRAEEGEEFCKPVTSRGPPLAVPLYEAHCAFIFYG